MMLLMYGVYCIVLHYNPIIEKWAQTWPVPCKRHPEEQVFNFKFIKFKFKLKFNYNYFYFFFGDRPVW